MIPGPVARGRAAHARARIGLVNPRHKVAHARLFAYSTAGPARSRGVSGITGGVHVAGFSPADRARRGVSHLYRCLFELGGHVRPCDAGSRFAGPGVGGGQRGPHAAASEAASPSPRRPKRSTPTGRPASRSTPAVSVTRASTTSPRRASKTPRRLASRPPSARPRARPTTRTTSRASSTRAASRSSRSASTRRRRPSTRRKPTPTSPSRRSTPRWDDDRPTAPMPGRTSPASTTRSTRLDARRLPRGRLQQDRQDRHLRRPAVPGRDPLHGRPVRRHPSTTTQKNGTNVQLLGWDAANQTGTFVGGGNPWGDPAKGEQLAKTFLDQGVDIVHPVAGATGNGTIKAMLAAGKWAIGVDTDQSISLPEYAGGDPDLRPEGHRRLGPRLHQEELRWRPRRRGLRGHARQQRRRLVAATTTFDARSRGPQGRAGCS